ncbi:SpaH/EbpB family LPXTG-anchored major pilin [Macrococcus bovicus]|uniref:SpaH/EbpB family LPXTG-anchored major pilin n=1 Tax=Macrococcus bovicus TaxID=69968 RepID=UPI0025A62012|nr:SpaH/EbpB family LPXTG-anchored major pilin [Macrococcus bovicus]WJP98193.1 SpaH/EbpB family LPXTG-anchored major pilin [Macrococcus bovicus]
MSTIAKRFSALLIITLIASLFAPFQQAFAAGPATNLTIHKITGDTARTSTYGELTGTETPTGEPISGISFTYWKVTSDQLTAMKANPSSYDTAAEVEAYLNGATGTATGTTAADGTVQVTNLAEGYYWFIENGSTAVKSSAAVPFGLELPITNEAGTGYITDLNVYPKNVLQDTPTIDKDVESDGNKSSSFAVGEQFNWLIQPTVPTGIEEYNKFEVTDKIATQLDFAGAAQVEVTVNGTELVAGTDFTAAYDAATRELKVVFTAAGIDKLGTFGAAPKLNILVPTTINNTAVMGQPILNNATLNFDNGHGITTEPNGTNTPVTPPTVPSTDVPMVYTGGKNFVKTNGSGTNLQGAQFVVKNAADEYLIQDATTKAVSWTTDKTKATVFTSDANGAFEVTGLPYGADGSANGGSTSYYIEETQAPSGYTLPTNPTTEFTVNSTSYYSDPTAVTAGAAATATPQEVINKQTSIPNTGGMGTVIFTVVGLGLMLAALMFFRRRQA